MNLYIGLLGAPKYSTTLEYERGGALSAHSPAGVSCNLIYRTYNTSGEVTHG